MEQALKAHQAIEQPHFGTINNPIEMLKDDHVSEGDLFAKIEALTKAVSNC
jgi:regulator of cell morphogenesis and NO signaling